MRAAVLLSPRQFELRELEVPAPAPDEVRMKVEYCGICSSNLAPWKGAPWFSYPFEPGAPGHETVGIVEELGADVADLEIGERVSMLGNHGFAEYEIAKANCVIPISSNYDQVPFLGEPLGCAMNVFRRAQVREGDWVAIVGTGFLGMILLQLSLEAGAKVIAISRRESALGIAKKMGATLTLSSKDRAQLLEVVRNATGQQLCHLVIEAAGAQETLDLASDLTGTRGRLVIAGYHQDGPRSVNMQEWNWRGIDVINAHEREEAVYAEGIRAAVQAVTEARIRLDELISHFFPFERIEEGFQTLERRPEGFIKGVVSLC
ncbi:MAG: zinc-binding dehydrogenase [Verrucomicrobia bacterium]|nr:zinc-binding dehydrogenase [Verrucomicrobiota bacterium]